MAYPKQKESGFSSRHFFVRSKREAVVRGGPAQTAFVGAEVAYDHQSSGGLTPMLEWQAKLALGWRKHAS